ncbi:MAG TPA: FHA domain-containing protein [Candidatus Aphodovivens avistercoris]|nr:FHA domain-containing protein [Candidatus Aphodovivens avistercoris]
MQYSCPVCGNAVAPDAGACPHCGFKLQGSTQSFQPIVLSEEGPAAQTQPARTEAVLRVVRGPQTGASFALSGSVLTVGRSPQCDIFLNDMTVSREHARLEAVAGGWRICDTNSFNGVWVANESVEARDLVPGDIIQIGAFCLRYEQA